MKEESGPFTYVRTSHISHFSTLVADIAFCIHFFLWQHHVWNKRVKQFPDVVFLCLRAQFLRDSRLLWRDVGQKKWNSSTAKEGTTAWSATIRPRQNHWGCSFTALLRKQRESFGTGTSCLEHYLKQCGPHSEIKDCQREKVTTRSGEGEGEGQLVLIASYKRWRKYVEKKLTSAIAREWHKQLRDQGAALIKKTGP